MSDLKTSVKINLVGNLERQSKRYTRSMEQFSRRSERHITRLGQTAQSVSRRLGSLGNRYAAVLAGGIAAFKTKQAVEESAKLDKELVQIAQTAGMTLEVTNQLRTALFNMARDTGQPIAELARGFNQLVQAGQSWDAALASIQAINPALAVTGSKADVLASALSVAKENFKFDLSDLNTVKLLLDQMVVAGRAGNAEIEDLSGIFARVGSNAKAANLTFAETLALVESFSKSEPNAERLATLTDSTLRLFSNQKQLTKASKATGVSFYDADGDRRAALDVLQDIAKKYQGLKKDVDRDSALARAFEGADLDTIKGLRKIFDGDTIFGIRKMAKELENAGGTLAKDLPDAINNSVDQVARLKTALRKAADDFSQPINDVIKQSIQFLLDEKKLSGKEIIAGGVATIVGGVAVAKLGSSLLSKVGGLAGGLASGKAIEQTTGVTPVFVVNMPGGGLVGGLLGGAAGSKVLKSALLGGARAGAIGLAVGGTVAASSVINEKLRSLNSNLKPINNQIKNKISLEISDKRVTVKQLKSGSKNTEIDIVQKFRSGAHFGAAL